MAKNTSELFSEIAKQLKMNNAQWIMAKNTSGLFMEIVKQLKMNSD